MLTVSDDGTGLRPGNDGTGLRGMRERALLIGAELHVDGCALPAARR